MTDAMPGAGLENDIHRKSSGVHNNFRMFHADDILEYLCDTENYYGEKYSRHHEWVEQNERILRENDDAVSFAEDGYYRYGISLPHVMRASVFVYAYGRLEHCLHTLCKEIQKALSLPLGPDDLKDKGFVRSRKYLEKVVALTLSDEEKIDLQIIEIYGILRNAIMHTNGILKAPQNEIERATEGFIHSVDGIELDPSRLLILEGGFVLKAVQRMEAVWKIMEQKACDAMASGQGNAGGRSPT